MVSQFTVDVEVLIPDKIHDLITILNSNPEAFQKAKIRLLKERLVTFYNAFLDLEQGSIPDKKIQDKIRKFWNEYSPSVTRVMKEYESSDWDWFSSDSFQLILCEYLRVKRWIDEYLSHDISEEFHIWLDLRLNEDIEFSPIKQKPGFIFLDVLDNIIFSLRLMIEEKWELGRCEFEGCEKIFDRSGPGIPQKYCCSSHKVKAFRSRVAQGNAAKAT